jgi:hypothetical protein
VTSPDGGSTDRDPQAENNGRNTPAPDFADSPPDQDPVRLTPPVDPWLAEAPTSVAGEDRTLRDVGGAAGEAPPADTAPYTAPYTEPAAFHSEPAYDERSSGWPGAPRRRRGRHSIRWILAVLVAAALFVAGMLAIQPFGFGDGGDALGSDPLTAATGASTPTGVEQQRPPAADATTAGQPGAGPVDDSTGPAAPATSDNAGSPEVVYEVTASGKRNTGRVEYTDQDGDIIRLSGIPLPWRTSFPVDGDGHPLVLIAQRKGGGDSGPVTCTITVGGKVLSSTTATGRYAAPQC